MPADKEGENGDGAECKGKIKKKGEKEIVMTIVSLGLAFEDGGGRMWFCQLVRSRCTAVPGSDRGGRETQEERERERVRK